MCILCREKILQQLSFSGNDSNASEDIINIAKHLKEACDLNSDDLLETVDLKKVNSTKLFNSSFQSAKVFEPTETVKQGTSFCAKQSQNSNETYSTNVVQSHKSASPNIITEDLKLKPLPISVLQPKGISTIFNGLKNDSSFDDNSFAIESEDEFSEVLQGNKINPSSDIKKSQYETIILDNSDEECAEVNKSGKFAYLNINISLLIKMIL